MAPRIAYLRCHGMTDGSQEAPMAEQEHEHGKMDISTQEKTFDGFVAAVGYGALVCILVLVFIGLVNG